METRSTNKKRKVDDEADVERKVDDEAAVERKVDEVADEILAQTEAAVDISLRALVAEKMNELLKPRERRVMITDEQYKELMSQVLALAERKQKNWKGSLINKHGVKSKLRYREGELQNLCSGSWNTVVSESVVKSEGSKKMPASDYGKWSLEMEQTHPDLSMNEKLALWNNLSKSDRQHTDPRRHGAGRHGDSSYNWTKDSTPNKKMKKSK